MPADSCAAGPPTLSLARPHDQARFRLTTFATGLSFPTSMTTLADGSLLVSESVGSMLWTSTTGRLVRLVDANAAGVADGPPQVLTGGSDLPGMVTSVRRVGDLVMALSSQTAHDWITF
jgi:glucose/arabinose dehydrogenase